MEPSRPKKGRNWYSAMGVLFIVSGAIVIIRDIIIWTPEFVADFIFDSEVNSAKISLGMFGFGGFLLVKGLRRVVQ